MKSTYKTATIGIVLLLAVGITSAAVLSSYGTITGTANVDPALEIENITNNTENVTEVTLENKLNREIGLAAEGVGIEINGETEELSDTISGSSNKTFTGLELGFTDPSDEVKLKIDGNVVFNSTVGDLNEN